MIFFELNGLISIKNTHFTWKYQLKNCKLSTWNSVNYARVCTLALKIKLFSTFSFLLTDCLGENNQEQISYEPSFSLRTRIDEGMNQQSINILEKKLIRIGILKILRQNEHQIFSRMKSCD